MNSTIRTGVITLLLNLVIFCGGCMPEIAATNPYDPETPIDQQKKASIELVVYGANNTDAEPITLQDVSITVADGPSQRETTVITDAEGLANQADLSLNVPPLSGTRNSAPTGTTSLGHRCPR